MTIVTSPLNAFWPLASASPIEKSTFYVSLTNIRTSFDTFAWSKIDNFDTSLWNIAARLCKITSTEGEKSESNLYLRSKTAFKLVRLMRENNLPQCGLFLGRDGTESLPAVSCEHQKGGWQNRLHCGF